MLRIVLSVCIILQGIDGRIIKVLAKYQVAILMDDEGTALKYVVSVNMSREANLINMKALRPIYSNIYSVFHFRHRAS